MTVSPTARHIGVCNFGVQDLADAMAIGVPIVSNQICYNLLCRTCIFLLPPPPFLRRRRSVRCLPSRPEALRMCAGGAGSSRRLCRSA